MGDLFLTWMVSGRAVPLNLVVSGLGDPYYAGQWKVCTLTFVPSAIGTPYYGGQWKRCTLLWCSVEEVHLTMVVSGRDASYIGKQLKRGTPYIGG